MQTNCNYEVQRELGSMLSSAVKLNDKVLSKRQKKSQV